MFSLALLSRSMTNRFSDIWVLQKSISGSSLSPGVCYTMISLFWLNLFTTTVACAILDRTFGFKLSPRVFDSCIRSSCPFNLISFWTLLTLFVISFIFPGLISISYFIRVAETVTRASSFCWYLVNVSVSSANHSLVIVLRPCLPCNHCLPKQQA